MERLHSVAFEHRTCNPGFFSNRIENFILYMYSPVSFPDSQTAKWLVHYIVCGTSRVDMTCSRIEPTLGRSVQLSIIATEQCWTNHSNLKHILIWNLAT